MPAWHDPVAWTDLLRGHTCPICRRGHPLDVIADLDSSWVSMPEEAPVRGYACLVFHRHAVELHDLTDAEGAAFVRDAMRLSRAVASVTGAVKLNYEVHGNTIPHLHLHVFPRYVGDPFEGGPIDPRIRPGSPYGAGELADLRTRVASALAAAT